jgi:hypothetical protein
MNFKLSNDDSCAVDLLLEHAQPGVNGGFSPCFSTAPSQTMLDRLSRVEGLLTVLGALPEVEPSGDLITRTLERCEDRGRMQSDLGDSTAPVITAR